VKCKQTGAEDANHPGWLAGLSDGRPSKSNDLFLVQCKLANFAFVATCQSVSQSRVYATMFALLMSIPTPPSCPWCWHLVAPLVGG